MHPKEPRQLTILATGIVATATLGAMIGWFAFDTHRTVVQLVVDGSRIEKLRGTILRLDEILTMSTHMAAATGEAQWEERYRQYEPTLDAAIQEAIDFTRDVVPGQHATQTDEANHRLVELENEAFECVRQDNLDAAAQLLRSEEYQEQKRLYAGGMSRLDAALKRRAHVETEHYRRRAIRIGTLGVIAGIILIIGWLAEFAVIRTHLKERSIAEESLEEAHRHLALRIEERTAELAQSNQVMQIEIAERTEAEKGLRRAKDYTDNIIRSMIDMLVVVAPDGRIVTINAATHTLLGYSEEELIGKPAGKLFCDDEETPPSFSSHDVLPFKGAILERLISDGAISDVEKSLRTKNGQLIPVITSGSVMRDNDGTMRGIVCVAQDITHRKRIEAELLETNRGLRAINEIHGTLFACQTTREVASALTKVLVDKFGAYFARVWLVGDGDLCSECALSEHCHDKSQCLHLEASTGHYTHIDGDHRRVPLGAFKIGLIAQRRGKTISNDVVNDERVHDREWAVRHGLQSFAGLPLLREGEVIGVMAMFSCAVLPQHLLDSLDLLAQMGSAAITNVERAEALRASEETFRSISESAQDAVIMMDSDGKVSYWNKAAEGIFGYSREEAIGRTLHSGKFIVPDRFFRSFYRNWSTFRESGRGPVVGKTTEMQGITKKGEEFPVELSLSAVKIKERWHAIGILRNITERKNVEERLRKLSLAVEQSPASVIVTDTQGTIEYVNPKFTEITGYTAEEVIGQTPRILKSGQKSQESYKVLWDTILAGHVWRGVFENKKKNGELYWEEASICPIRDPNGSVTHFVAVKQDITERKQAEALLLQSESELRTHRDHLEELVSERTAELAKINESLVHEVEERLAAERAAEAANSAKGNFLATMSHELRTPLNGVIGMMELLLGSELNPRQRRHAWLAKTSGDTLLALITDILDFSKIESGKLELESTNFDLRYTVESLGASFASRAEGKGLELICSVHPCLPAMVQGDPGRLQQILMNLTTNAIKFTERGQVVVRATKDEDSDDDVTVRFTVSDTGIGIPRDRHHRLFQSFSQVDASTTRKHGGTGLGLIISKQLVELMGGQIGVESEPGQGSTFWFTVKLKRQADGESAARTLNGNMKHLRILTVDDNPTNREMLAEQLSSFGFENETAGDGQEALAMLRNAANRNMPFGLAIVDMQMPGMDGEQLAQAILADQSLKRTVLLLLTSEDNGDDSERPGAIGFSGWLTKPVRQSRLLDTIVETLARADSTLSGDQQVPVDKCPPRTQRKKNAKSAGARILLAEDNEISADVAMALLGQVGYQCDTVVNGKQAVQAVLDREYDLVLMDCQMPEMDGFDATLAIRQHEKDGSLSRGKKGRLPIIALTANAIKGDRERCLDTGMDDYLTKPIDSDQLVAVIENHLSGIDDASNQTRVNATVGSEAKLESTKNGADPAAVDVSAPFDFDGLYKRWGVNKPFAEKLIAKFCSQAPTDLKKLERSVADGNIEETTRLAHGLKGAASYVSADAFRRVAARLEEMGRAADMTDAENCLKELRIQMQRCLECASDHKVPVESQRASTKC